MPYQNKHQVITGLVVIQDDKPYGLKFISVWEPCRLKYFVPLKDYQTPEQSSCPVFI